jgi:hypothetical protein
MRWVGKPISLDHKPPVFCNRTPGKAIAFTPGYARLLFGVHAFGVATRMIIPYCLFSNICYIFEAQ